MFTKRELLHLLICVFVLVFVFGFDDGSKTFVLGNWLSNFFWIFLLIAVAVLFRELIVKLFAKRHDAKSEYEILSVKQVWFNLKLDKGIPFGVLFALVLSIASKGKFFFTAMGKHDFIGSKISRVGRKYQSLEYYEEAQIASMGILSSLFLAVLGLLLGRIFDVNMNIFVGINFYLALFNMLPFSDLDGAKIFFGSLLIYIYLLIFIVVAFLLIKTSVVLGLLIAFLVASVATISYYYKWG